MEPKQTELIHQQEVRNVAKVTPAEPPDILSVIARAASDPSVDVRKMEQLLAMQERIIALAAKQQFFSALARLQARMPRISKHGDITFQGKAQYRYAKYEDIDEAIRPLLAEEGFSTSFDTDDSSEPGFLKVILYVMHSSGHTERRFRKLPFDRSGSKNEVQSSGSTESYARRYLITGFFNIITTDEDNDGRGEPITQEQTNKLLDLLLYTESDVSKFLAWLGVKQVEDIPRDRFADALAALDKKAKVKRDRA